jgi:hypothetical protein
MIKRFGLGAGVVAIKPFPLQLEVPGNHQTGEPGWRESLALESFQSNSESATQKLRDYYSRLGFKALPDTPYMVLSTAFTLPQIDG